MKRAAPSALLGCAVLAAAQGWRLLRGWPQGWSASELMPALLGEAGLGLAMLALTGFATIRLSRWRGHNPRPGLIIGLVTGALFAASLWRFPAPGPALPPASPGHGGRVLVLLTGDTLRRDHVSAYPDAVADLTPNLATLAEQGLRFDQARAPAPLTLPVHISLLTGLSPAEHGLLRNGELLTGHPRAVPEILGESGWWTAAFTGSPIVHGSSGLGPWFQTYRDELGPTPGHRQLLLMSALDRLIGATPTAKERGDRTVARALRWLDGLPADADAFLWVHLYDAHGPYDELNKDDAALPDNRATLPHPCDFAGSPSALRGETTGLIRAMLRQSLGEGCQERSWETVYSRADQYAAGVRALDTEVGALITGLEARGRWARTSLLFVADHGESLTEHSQWGSHQFSLYDPVLRVPLILRAPSLPEGLTAGQVIDTSVSTLAVAATLARLAGVEPPRADPDLLVQNTVSKPQISVGPLPRPPGLTGHPLQAAAEFDSVKVIVSNQGPPERYDLVADPREQRALSSADEIAARRASDPAAHGRGPALLPVQRALDEAAYGVLATPQELAPFAEAEAAANAALQALIDADARRAGHADADALSDDLRRSLQVLGYLQ